MAESVSSSGHFYSPTLVIPSPASEGKSGKGDNTDNGRIFHYTKQLQLLYLTHIEQQKHIESLQSRGEKIDYMKNRLKLVRKAWVFKNVSKNVLNSSTVFVGSWSMYTSF